MILMIDAVKESKPLDNKLFKLNLSQLFTNKIQLRN